MLYYFQTFPIRSFSRAFRRF